MRIRDDRCGAWEEAVRGAWERRRCLVDGPPLLRCGVMAKAAPVAPKGPWAKFERLWVALGLYMMSEDGGCLRMDRYRVLCGWGACELVMGLSLGGRAMHVIQSTPLAARPFKWPGAFVGGVRDGALVSIVEAQPLALCFHIPSLLAFFNNLPTLDTMRALHCILSPRPCPPTGSRCKAGGRPEQHVGRGGQPLRPNAAKGCWRRRAGRLVA